MYCVTHRIKIDSDEVLDASFNAMFDENYTLDSDFSTTGEVKSIVVFSDKTFVLSSEDGAITLEEFLNDK